MRGEVGIFEIGKDHAQNLTIHLKPPPSSTPATAPYNYHIMTTTNSCIWSFERVFAILMGMERLNGVEFVYHAVLPFLPMAVFVVDA